MSSTAVADVDGQRQLVAAAAEVGEVSWLDAHAVRRDRAVEHDEGVLERRLQRHGRGPGPQLQVDPEMVGVAPGW